MSQPQQSTIRNRLLKVLAPDEFERLAPHLETMPLAIRRVLIAPNEPITHAMFVEGGVCSLIADTSEGRVEIGMIGYEGFIGVPLLLGTNRSPHMALVQADGVALRIAAPELVEALQELCRILGDGGGQAAR